MNEKIPWEARKAAILVVSLEAEIASLLFMLLKERTIDTINRAMDVLNTPSEEEKSEVIIQYNALLNTRIIKETEGKDYARGYLEKTYSNTGFMEKLIEDTPLANASVYQIQAEMEVLQNTVIKNLKSKVFLKSVDQLRAELAAKIVQYPVDAAMVLTFLLQEQK
mgnify:FL=1